LPVLLNKSLPHLPDFFCIEDQKNQKPNQTNQPTNQPNKKPNQTENFMI
jgi:hypothetical protein